MSTTSQLPLAILGPPARETTTAITIAAKIVRRSHLRLRVRAMVRLYHTDRRSAGGTLAKEDSTRWHSGARSTAWQSRARRASVPDVRSLVAWNAAQETPLDGFRADQAMAAAVARRPERALLRAWTRPEPALSVGRYHRMEPSAHGMQRRLSGGRIVPVGPGVLGLSLAFGSAAWLSAGSQRLRPDQVLNRALRPALAMLRDLGLDAFYPGRDVVTVGDRVVMYASFCVFADDVLLVEQMLSLESPFSDLETMARRLDPDGIAGIDLQAFDGATTMKALTGKELSSALMLERTVEAATTSFACSVESRDRAPHASAAAVLADEGAYLGFLAEHVRVAPERRTAAAFSMLGAVEASARIEDRHVRELEITGDVIAPFFTLEALARACEGEVAEPKGLRDVVARVLAEEPNFVLGVRDLPEIVARLAA
jgi:lipoate-protein ligase A